MKGFILEDVADENIEKAINSLSELIEENKISSNDKPKFENTELVLKSSTFKSKRKKEKKIIFVNNDNNNNNNESIFRPETHKVTTEEDFEEELLLFDDLAKVEPKMKTDEEIHHILVDRYDDIYDENSDPSQSKLCEKGFLEQEVAFFQNILNTTISSPLGYVEDGYHVVPLGISEKYAVAILTKNVDDLPAAEKIEADNFIAITKERFSIAPTKPHVEFAFIQYKKLADSSNILSKFIPKIQRYATARIKEIEQKETESENIQTSLLQQEVMERSQPGFDIYFTQGRSKTVKRIKYNNYELSLELKQTLGKALVIRAKTKRRNARRKGKKNGTATTNPIEKNEKAKEEKEEETPQKMAEGTLMIASLANFKDITPQWRKCSSGKISSTNNFYVSEKNVAVSTKHGVDIYKLPRGIQTESYSIAGFPSEVEVSDVFVDKDFVACLFKNDFVNLQTSCQGAIFNRQNGDMLLLFMKKGMSLTSILREPSNKSFWLGFSNGCVYCISTETRNIDPSLRSVCMIPNEFPIRKMYRIGRQIHCQTTVDINTIDVVPLENESIEQMFIRSGNPMLYRNPDISAFWRYGLLQVVVSRDHMIYITHTAMKKTMKSLVPPPSLQNNFKDKESGNSYMIQEVTPFPLRQHVRLCGDTLIVLYSNADVRFTWTTDEVYVPPPPPSPPKEKEKKEEIVEEEK